MSDDAEERRRAVEETDRSFLVEASAGTGKTTLLVGRILRLVVHDGVPLSRIAALTFTEKAAGEMKARLRSQLAAAAGTATGVERERVSQALRELPGAEVTTLHAFSARILRERPVEADVDLDFRAPDESVSAELITETVDAWIRAEAGEPGSAVSAALSLGARPDDIAAIAQALVRERLVLATSRMPFDALAELRAELAELAEGFREVLAATSTRDLTHARAREARRLAASVDALGRLPEAALGGWTPEDLLAGHRSPWDRETRERAAELRKSYTDLPRRLASFALEPTVVALVRSIESSLFGAVEAEKRRRGLVDFDDLLLLTRQLLRTSPSVRKTFRRRFERLLVDEFQDTDPVQAEIVLRLAAPEPQAPGDWSRLVPRPGSLFLVGDPKQSIYRFRRADVETYQDVKARFAPDERLTLRASFRAAPAVVSYVNEVGERMLRSDPGRLWEVEYAPLQVGRAWPEEGRIQYLLPPLPDDAAARTIDRADEARAVAAWLASGGPGRRLGDIAVLVSRNASLAIFHEALLDAGVPVVLDGGVSLYRREETAAAIAALRVVDDPGDAVSLVATFKSFLFGHDDLELLAAREAGARYDDLGSTLPEGSALGPAWETLLALHRGRHDRPAAETLLSLLTARLSFAAVNGETSRDPRQAIANLEHLVAVTRELDREGLSFSGVVRRLSSRLDEEHPEPRAFEETEDAVRLLTIHRAKGLEFPVVVLTDLADRPLGGGPDDPFRCDRAGGSWAVRLKLGASPVGTPGWARIQSADRARSDAEAKRLLYVGLTRAAHTLVVSWFRPRYRKKDGDVSDPIGASYFSPIAWAEEPALLSSRPTIVDPAAPPPRLRLVPPVPEGEPPELAAELARLASWRVETARSVTRPVRRAGEDEPAEDLAPDDASPSRRHPSAPATSAIAIGLAVHSAMEALLSPGRPAPTPSRVDEELRRLTAELAPRDRLEARQLVRRLVGDPTTLRALASRRRFVEMPVLFLDGDGPDAPLVEGKIDLVFEEADRLVVVDWKTDRVDTPDEMRERSERHLPQLRAYAEGLRRVLGAGAPYVETRLVFARAPLPRSGAQLSLFET